MTYDIGFMARAQCRAETGGSQRRQNASATLYLACDDSKLRGPHFPCPVSPAIPTLLA